MAKVRPFLLALFIFALASVSRGQGFAVQVASFASQNEAEMAVTNLRGRGVEAYWVKPDASGAAYRVRIGGRFTNDQQASSYATKLVGEGVVREYAIQQYAPSAPVAQSSVNAPPGLSVDGLAGHALPARAAKPSAPSSHVQTLAAARQPVSEKKAARAYAPHADDVSLDDLAEFSDAPLESKIEKREDRLLLYVRNRHGRNVFRGTVRLTLQDAGQDSAIQPWQFMLKASEDSTYDLNAKVSQRGSYWVEVLDDRGKPQMIKAASLEPRQPKNESKKEEPSLNSLVIAKAEEDEDAPPKDYKMRVASDNGTGAPPLEPEAKKDAKPEELSRENVQTGEIKIIVRKVAESAENVTLEFEIQAPAPLGMISVALQTVSTTDFKQAIMTTKLGRIPFLVPLADTSGSFNFELKDESGRVLASGQKSFQEFKKN